MNTDNNTTKQRYQEPIIVIEPIELEQLIAVSGENTLVITNQEVSDVARSNKFRMGWDDRFDEP
jgi:hypothetical protein